MELPRTIISQYVTRGMILHSDIFEDIGHAKFFVVMGVYNDSIAGFFYINSNINRHINKKEEQLKMQYPLYTRDYDFLAHDSYICATNIVELHKSAIETSIIEKRTKIVSNLKPEHLNELLYMVRESKLFSPIVKTRYFA